MTADGPKWLADAIVYATGFQASKVLSPMVVKGVGGLDLHATWGPDDAKAFLGMTVAGLPNFFMLLGPKTGLAHGGNASFMTECQVRYVGLCIDALGRSMHSVMDVRTEVFDRYTAEVDRLHDALVWRHKGLINWYRNEAGRVFA